MYSCFYDILLFTRIMYLYSMPVTARTGKDPSAREKELREAFESDWEKKKAKAAERQQKEDEKAAKKHKIHK